MRSYFITYSKGQDILQQKSYHWFMGKVEKFNKCSGFRDVWAQKKQ